MVGDFGSDCSTGATASQFKLQVDGVPLTWVGDSSPFPGVIGNTSTGVAVAYGSCLVSPIHVVQATFMGTSAACDMVRVVDDPIAVPPGIYMTDCASPVPNLVIIPGGSAYVNDDGTCPCNVPAEDTSWGQIKALYQ